MREGKDRSVLLISADLDVRDGLKEIFLGAPWLLVAAVNPNGVMEKVREMPPAVILIDTSFYEEERRHLLAALNQIDVLRGKPVVFLTAEKDRDGRIGGWVLKGLNGEAKASTREAFFASVGQMIALSGKETAKDAPPSQEVVDGRLLHPDFGKFKKYLMERFARSDA